MNNNKQSQDQQQQHGKNQIIIEPQKCPRCDSTNTKFCYYNNYSLSQPRYFCKTCRRYWTQGGTLRNVPVGGGCRKGKRPKTAASSVTQQPTSDSYLGDAANGNFLTPTFGALQTTASTAMMSLLQGLGDVAGHGQFYMSSNNQGGTNINSFSVPQIQSFNNDNNNNMISGVNWNNVIGDNGDVGGSTVRASEGNLVNIPDDQWPEIPRSYGSPPP